MFSVLIVLSWVCLILGGWLFVYSRVSMREVNLWLSGIVVKCRFCLVLVWCSRKDGVCVLMLLVCSVILLFMLVILVSSLCILLLVVDLFSEVMILKGSLMWFR